MRLLVTGATGFLGSELVPHLVKAGHEVVVLVREPQGYAPPDGAQVVKGDITAFDLGLKTPLRLDAVFHVAAVVSFKESDRAAIYAANCKGTCNVINYCLNHRVGRCYYVSTVYVCGDYGRQLCLGPAWTEPCHNQGQGFRNHYERSKFLAEGYLREAARGFAGTHDPLKVTIFRPSIIVGRASIGQATTMVDLVATKVIDPMEVDRVSHPPRTYHLVNPRPLTNAQVCAADMAGALQPALLRKPTATE